MSLSFCLVIFWFFFDVCFWSLLLFFLRCFNYIFGFFYRSRVFTHLVCFWFGVGIGCWVWGLVFVCVC